MLLKEYESKDKTIKVVVMQDNDDKDIIYTVCGINNHIVPYYPIRFTRAQYKKYFTINRMRKVYKIKPQLYLVRRELS